MGNTKYLTRSEVERRLSPYKATFQFVLTENSELWTFGWGKAFTMRREADGTYDEWEILTVLDTVALTIPYDWHEKNPS